MIQLQPLFCCLLSTLVIGNLIEEEMSPNNQDRQLLQLEVIGSFVGTLATGAGIAASMSGYGVKLHIKNKICKELNFEGIAVSKYGYASTPCSDIGMHIPVRA